MAFSDFFKKKNSKDLAKGRLECILRSDRLACSPEVMESIKNDIIKVISKYLEIDAEGLDVQIDTVNDVGGTGKVTTLRTNIPIKEVRPRSGLK